MQSAFFKKASRGFTLIELLVVIAIIGILAAIVLASLGTARSKGNDAKVKEQLNSMRNAAEVYYSANNNYGANTAAGGDCGTNAAGSMAADTASGFNSLVVASNWPGSVAPVCHTNGSAANGSATAYTAWHVLSDGTFWCVDSAGKSVSEASGFTQPAVGASTQGCP